MVFSVADDSLASGSFANDGKCIRRLRSHTQFALTTGLLLLALSFGGGQGTLADTLIQLTSVGLLMLLVVRAGRVDSVPLPLWTWWPVLVLAAVPLLQSLPIPESLWRSLAGRAELAEQLASAEVAARFRWGLNPTGGERSLFWLLPAFAIYLSVLRLPSRDRMRLLLVVLMFAAASVVLGLAQMAGGTDSPLRLYSNTNRSSAVGMFANRNHFALLLAMALPLAMAWVGRAIDRGDADRGLWLLRIVLGVGICLLLILGLMIARSRAGLLLGLFAILATTALLLSAAKRGSGPAPARIPTSMIAIVLIMSVSMLAVLRQVGSDPLQDQRWAHAETTVLAAQAYAPFGSGLGTFREAFQPYERESAAGTGRPVVNHAHNDYLEAWLEAGWLALLAAALLLITLSYAIVRALDRSTTLAFSVAAPLRATIVALLLPVLHSLVDYPLRTSAHLALFGLLAGLVVAFAVPRRSPGRSSVRPESRVLRRQ